MEIREDDIVMCTVKKIEGTTVFVKIDDDGEGSIVMSEIAAGRIRNLRDYVTIGKKIVCKVLSTKKGYIELSLRRVTGKEKEEMKERYQRERTLFSMLKASTKKPEDILKKIKESFDVPDFLETVRSNLKILEKFLTKLEVQVFTKILAEKKEKDKIVKKNVIIKSYYSEGIKDIKEVLKTAKGVDISYLGSSRFSIMAKARDFKSANTKVSKTIEQLKQKAREKRLFFELEEKK